jgi:hypothetical protein
VILKPCAFESFWPIATNPSTAKDFYVVESLTLDQGQDATSTKSQRHPL